MKRTLIRASIIFAVAVGISFLLSFIMGAFSAEKLVDRYKLLCDGFFVVAVVLIAVGMLIFCTNGGTFDMLVFGTKKFFGSIFSSRKKLDEKSKTTFADYREERMGKRSPFLHLVISGGGIMIIALIFFALYSQVAV